MKTKISVYIASSLDGFIADQDGGLEWLDEASLLIPKGEDCGYLEFISTVDLLIMGKNTYHKVRGFAKWPYGKLKVMVAGLNPDDIPKELQNTVSASSKNPEELMHELRNKDIKHVYVDGGKTICSYLEKGLLSDLIITTIPVILGGGIPLFNIHSGRHKLELVRSQSWDFGFVQNHWKIQKIAEFDD